MLHSSAVAADEQFRQRTQLSISVHFFFFVYFLLLLPSTPPFRLNWMQAPSSEHDDTCYGTDLNRNWKHEWNERGSSNSPCSDFYAGPKAFSDPETKALSEYLQDNRKYLNVCQTFFFSRREDQSGSQHKSTKL